MNDEAMSGYFLLPLQISGEAWRHNGLSPERLKGAPSSLYPMRQLALHWQRQRPQAPIRPTRLHLLGLLNRALRQAAGNWFDAHHCRFVADGVRCGERRLRLASLVAAENAFVEHFPPAAVLQGAAAATYLAGARAEEHRRLTTIELFLLAVQTQNPAVANLRPLFDDAPLEAACPYRRALTQLDAWLAREPDETDDESSLLALLRRPLEASPESLGGQLQWAQRHWRHLLSRDLLTAILIAFDTVAEEEKCRQGGPGPTPIPRFAAPGLEPDRFSPDREWMPQVVLLAKTIHVWLWQLSRRYETAVERLDQIPDAELDRIAAQGFTGLWLIGIWERSKASERIKRRMGNHEAVASAYSLFDYTIAVDLGGEAALDDLDARCRRRGIRLACDVVPNHTGICSRWLREHPERFLHTDRPPFPSYRFSGPDLSSSAAMEVRIEDGYWDRSEAAVVFQHIDRKDGRVRYVYHGNDGTHLPWNDTAQLNFLLPEVREAMIRTIIAVARRFPIIRFDAAMTLARKHFQRLWFPAPGSGDGVPSRAEHALAGEEFERLFPVEFWREVVDRVAAETPDTLLLAEAFWLMEGFFVRTLGMHRVYNSAFMNMLKSEDNDRYRATLKNVLEFDPQILKRFVNFMNNPDEATAVAQFGKGDKYFAVAVLLATMPGLPMFGHGQIEGLEEKYGMEYRRPYRDEEADAGFVRHHESQIFPLLRRRRLFSDSRHFQLYDFGRDGRVDENVFVLSNRREEERGLVVVHNRDAETSGRILQSVGKRPRKSGPEPPPQRVDLARGLAIPASDDSLWRCREQDRGMEYLFSGRQLAEGLELHLGPYQHLVFLDFAPLPDPDGGWRALWQDLQGKPVPDLERSLQEMRIGDLADIFRALLDDAVREELQRLLENRDRPARNELAAPELEDAVRAFFAEAQRLAGAGPDDAALVRSLFRDLADWRDHCHHPGPLGEHLRRALAAKFANKPRRLHRALWAWLLLRRLQDRRLQELLLARIPDPAAEDDRLLIGALLDHSRALAAARDRSTLGVLLADENVRRYLRCHRHDEAEWLNREQLQELLRRLFAAAGLCPPLAGQEEEPQRLEQLQRDLAAWLEAAAEAGYRLDKLLDLV